MPKISTKKLIGLNVFTQSEEMLGKVDGFIIETDSQSIIEYSIKPAGLIRGFLTGDLIISRGQVIDINESKMIVDDTSLTDDVKEKIKNPAKAKIANAMMKEKKVA